MLGEYFSMNAARCFAGKRITSEKRILAEVLKVVLVFEFIIIVPDRLIVVMAGLGCTLFRLFCAQNGRLVNV